MSLIVEMLEKNLEDVNKKLAPFDELLAERGRIEAALAGATGAKTKSATNGGVKAPAVPDEDLLGALNAETAQLSSDVAKTLGVKPQAISRKLVKMAKEGVIQGGKDEGYTLNKPIQSSAAAA